MAANYQHIGGHENRLGRHYSRFSAFWSPAALTDQSLALRKSQNAGSNGRSRASYSYGFGISRDRRWAGGSKNVSGLTAVVSGVSRLQGQLQSLLVTRRSC